MSKREIDSERPLFIVILTFIMAFYGNYCVNVKPYFYGMIKHFLCVTFSLPPGEVKIWFQNRRMKWRNSKERELLASGGSREQTLPNKNNPHPDLSDAEADKPKLTPLPEDEELKNKIYASTSNCQSDNYRYEDKMAAGMFSRESYQNEEVDDYESDSASDEEINVT